MYQSDTIAAPITAPGVGAVAVVRISGPKTRAALEALCENGPELLSEPRKMHLSALRDGRSGENLDTALAVFFAAPNSYTGEDLAEISVHGSPFILKRLLENLGALDVRGARPGEFTERAYLNGKLDLAQSEAVLDLIHAETEGQARVAREQLEGRLSTAISDLGTPLRDLLAQIEAYIDFPEEDIEPLKYSEWDGVISGIAETLRRYASSYVSGRLYRDGASVVLMGLPNSGKSSLLNALAGDDRAIVTPVAGTTRDSIEERISLDGLLVRLWDTAGIAKGSADKIEQLGIERSWKHARSADLILFLYDLSQPFDQQQELLSELKDLSAPVLFVGNKSDLVPSPTPPKELGESSPYFISAKTGLGIEALQKAIVTALVGAKRESVLVVTERHAKALNKARESLEEARRAIAAAQPPEFVSVSLRASLVALEEIVGVTTTEDILGVIFSKFCIGK